jgi:KaiC/GvpD/RAD55 family RecA-like ATPase
MQPNGGGLTGVVFGQPAGDIRRPSGGGSAADELERFVNDVVAGRILVVPFPWQTLSRLTQALLPGSVTVICGDPGVGKTFFVMDCLRFWVNHGHDAAAFFLEKDRKFYTRRLLAQEEGMAKYLDLEWLKAHGGEAAAAMKRHRAIIDTVGDRMTLEGAGRRATIGSLCQWVETELRNGRRILIIDPITAADAGADRWRTDDGFMTETQKLLSRYGASLVLVTHPRKGNVTQKSGHDIGGGAAYFRFSDTTLWLTKLKSPKRVRVVGPFGIAHLEASTFVQIHKVREGPGMGCEVAFSFGDGLHFAEQGVVVGAAESDAA